MSKIDVVRAAMVEAMKAKDKDRKDSLSMLLSALKNAEIDKRSPLTEEEENAVVKKELRQTKETMDTAPAGRTDIIEEARQRMAVYQEFAPEEMSEEAVLAEVKAVLAALGEAEIGIGDPEYPDTAQTSLSLALSAQAYSIVSAAVAQTLIPEEEPKQKKS